MNESYWANVLNQRLGRRRALAATGVAATSAVLLAACGSGSSNSSSGKGADSSGFVAKPADTTAQAKRGGISKDRAFADPPTLDILTSNNPWGSAGQKVYNSLVLFKPGYLKPTENEVGPDLAESWEYPPDGLQITLKLRSNLKFHNKPPVNGRAVDMDDVLFSWNRFAKMGSRRTEIVNAANPNAPVLSVTAADARTLVFKLKEPFVSLLNYLEIQGAGNPHILPKEADSQIDIRQKVIGTGPFVLAEYTPSVGTVWKRNTNYYDKVRPYLDLVNEPIISEYAQGVAQLQAGSLHTYAVRGEDILSVKGYAPALQVYQSDVAVLGQQTIFGWKPDPPERSPFRDIRLRQAYSMAWDRDLVIDVVYNVGKFATQGLPVETRWSTAIPANFYEGWWLDPKGKEFGENARYFQHNLAEARKLIAAAGFQNGVDVVSNTFTTAEYGPDFPKQVDLIEGMAAEAGFKFVRNVVNYNTDFIPKFRDAKGNFEGLSYKLLAGGASDAVSGLLAGFSVKAGSDGFHGFDVDGKGNFGGDPYIDDQLSKAKAEVDAEKQKAIVGHLVPSRNDRSARNA